ncbi:MAG: phosphoribosylformylglycinamidine cyclo-ligase [Jatrophihabitans sp.]|uniref:phosphoribosylformylglycinamidine cyclo-ligase n=1 Tax=Jatrophihabitans sp. TaxID=1932789 RepID=UPI003F7EEC0E
MSEQPPSPASTDAYARAGVDIAAGDRAVELMKASVRRTARPELLGGLGGFAGLFQLDLARWPQPVLASSTDGVGTKLAIAQALDRHDTIGIDLVAMVVDDLVVVGAEPLFLSDYIATGKVVPEKIAAIVGGIAEGCVRAGCALVGGETAEHPGVMAPDEYDISGTGVGVVNADAVLGADRVQAGDVLIAMASSGLHSNGYSLVRHVLLQQAGLDLGSRPDLLGGDTLGDVLLTPTRIYAQDCLALAAEVEARAFAHITGGGLAGNLVRVLPPTVDAVVQRDTWTVPPVFALVQQAGDVPLADLELALNLGVGMVAVVPAHRSEDALRLLAERGVPAWTLGTITPGTGQVTLVGTYQGLSATR